MNSKSLSKDSKVFQSSLNFFAELIEHPGTQLGVEGPLLEPYYSNRSVKQSKDKNTIGIITDILSGLQQNSALEFQSAFVYGVQMEMWRKDSLKPIIVFVDQNLPNLVWFSSKTKAFLFDMTYTDIDRCELDLEKKSGMKQYFILRYFEQEIPLIFRKEGDLAKYFRLFNNYIKYNRFRQYPPFFSRIMKLYTVEEVKSNISRKKNVEGILNITKDVFDIDPAECETTLMMVYQAARKEQMTAKSELKTNQIRDFFQILHCSENLMKIFQKYSEQRLKSRLDYLQKPMSKDQFVRFLQMQQKLTREEAEIVGSTMNQTMHFYEFCVFLENEKLNHAAEGIKIDESLPLTDYFCYSSHNTYLSGNQLTSDCKIERYLQDLQRGLKCVEIDIHNDGDTPIINHAMGDTSLCTPINFEETISEIAKFCDTYPKHYPIILSIQNHAKEQNRYKVANILLKYLIKQIFFINEAYQNEQPTYFKPLKQLRGKIIIKTDSKLAELISFKKKPISLLKSNLIPFHSPQPKFPSASFQQSFDKFQATINNLIKRKEDFDLSMPNSLFLPISEMTKVTSLFKSENGIENQYSKGCECTSLNNTKSVIQKDEEKVKAYTRRSFLRIYPQGTEIASKNYDPVPHLKIGAQIIALNTQTKDDYAWMLMSYFKAGKSDEPLENIGFIQKPYHLRSNKPKPNIKKIVKIQIMSEIKDIELSFIGSERDMKTNEKNKKQNCFEAVDYDEAFLIFKINQNLKECIPIRFIREGYRVLVAKNSLFKDSGIRVIIHVAITLQQL